MSAEEDQSEHKIEDM